MTLAALTGESVGTIEHRRLVQRRMHADTDAIRSYGGTTSDLGWDIHGVATALSAVGAATITEAFGHVGSRFAAALAEAAADLANAVAGIGEAMTSSGTATTAAAISYDDVERRSRAAITRLET